jgi:hypothetical protein
MLIGTTATCAGTAAYALRREGGARLDGTELRREDNKSFPVERMIAPPTPLGPRDGTVSDDRGVERLVWTLDDRTDGARVELSPTCDFAESTTVHIDVGGEEVRVPLIQGTWCWRLRGRLRGAVGERTSRPSTFRIVEARASSGPRALPPRWDHANPYERWIRNVPFEPTCNMR